MARTSSSVNGTVNAQEILRALRSVKKGDFTVRMPDGQGGVSGQIAEAFNDVVEMLQNCTGEVSRITNVVGKEGRIRQRASFGGAAGSWATLIDSINTLIADLVQPTEEVSRVIGGVAKGDLSQPSPWKAKACRLAASSCASAPSSTRWSIS